MCSFTMDTHVICGDCPNEMTPKGQVALCEASAYYMYAGLALPSISVSWMMILDKDSLLMLVCSVCYQD